MLLPRWQTGCFVNESENCMEKRLIIFIDGGDTLIEEGSLDRDEDVVIAAAPIPGSLETLRELKNSGYKICLVDNVRRQSVQNVFTHNGYIDCFDSISTLDEAGVGKPAHAIFDDAMKQNGLTDSDRKRIVMVGNSCRNDIAGANRYGITSVLMDWSPHHSMTPHNADEVPDFIIHELTELPGLLERLESKGYEKI